MEWQSIDTSLRPATIELCCIVLRRLLLSLESDQLFHTAVEDAVNRSMQSLVATLRGIVLSDSLFLDMFEDEFYELQVEIDAAYGVWGNGSPCNIFRGVKCV